MTDPTDIRPFRIEVPDDDLDDLHRRLDATRWPDEETVDDWSQGIPRSYVQELATYWRDTYDWRAREARLNEFPQFVTDLDGLDVHFLHVRSPHEHARPMVMTHGWPGSIAEFQDVIGPLTDPTAHGGDAADAFHVVCPSLPGYGFSAKPTEPGWGVGRIAAAWDTLMARLGYDRYVAQGGDWGSMVTTLIGARHGDHCAGVHLNMPIVIPSSTDDLSEAEQQTIADFEWHRQWGTGYSKIQSTRPQTLGYGLADSPVGQLGWIVEKFQQWTDNDGHPEDAVDRDHLLDNVMLYWLANAGASSARLYWESFDSPPFEVPQVPVGCSIFPREIFRTSRRWAEAHFGEQLVHFNELERGGHFAAFEVPDLFVDEVRTCFRQLA
ncbi:MAG: epoxide hydrolase [Acidimicrobiales bacterium]|nr:epoxide hydrolase [Acidimicrobiales bacterium]